MVRQFHDGMQARVQNDIAYCEPFTVTNGVKQVCPTAIFCGCTARHVSDLVENRFSCDVGHITNYCFDSLFKFISQSHQSCYKQSIYSFHMYKYTPMGF